MIPLFLYLLCAGLVVLGALAFIVALQIPSPVRMAIACLLACVPVATGVYLFRSSGLKISDWDRLLRSTDREMKQMGEGMRRNKETQDNLMKMIESDTSTKRTRR